MRRKEKKIFASVVYRSELTTTSLCGTLLLLPCLACSVFNHTLKKGQPINNQTTSTFPCKACNDDPYNPYRLPWYGSLVGVVVSCYCSHCIYVYACIRSSIPPLLDPPIFLHFRTILHWLPTYMYVTTSRIT